MFFSKTDSIREALQAAETELLAFAHSYGDRSSGDYQMQPFDTVIPSLIVPLKKQDDEELTIHGIHVYSKNSPIKTPLVLQHGYMNGGAYFYRNLVGLSKHYQHIYALDMLGWGLSSRPTFDLVDDSVETAQDFFVESLEAWRKAHGLTNVVLGGHSMGGYLSVAYCERYPQYVERLVLLSPVGVPQEDDAIKKRRLGHSYSRKFVFGIVSKLFERGSTPCSVVRTMPTSKGRQLMEKYVEKRLPSITDPQEQVAVANYLYYNCAMPGSGEYALNRILTVHAFAKQPLVNRIPLLKVSHVAFLYGAHDWMDYSGGIASVNQCRSLSKPTPKVNVFTVDDAGHLLMLDNWREFNSSVAIATGAQHLLTETCPRPTELTCEPFDNKVDAESEEIVQPTAQTVQS